MGLVRSGKYIEYLGLLNYINGRLASSECRVDCEQEAVRRRMASVAIDHIPDVAFGARLYAEYELILADDGRGHASAISDEAATELLACEDGRLAVLIWRNSTALRRDGRFRWLLDVVMAQTSSSDDERAYFVLAGAALTRHLYAAKRKLVRR